MKGPKNDEDNWVRSLGLFSLIVSDLLICTGLGVGGGYWAMKHWGTPGWVAFLAGLAGLVVAFYRIYRYSGRQK